MKKILLLYVLPLTVAIFAVPFCAFSPFFNNLFLKPSGETSCYAAQPFLDNFSNNSWYEEEFLNLRRAEQTIYLLGSSELTEGGDAIPYHFINKHFPHMRVQGLGHAGNQCFSIFSQLLANQKKLDSAKITFIISPGWFESKPSKGTSSAIFLEYNSEFFLKRILHDHLSEDSIFKVYEEKRIHDLYSEFNSPNLPLRLLNYEHQFSKSIFHKALFALPMMLDHHLISKKRDLTHDRSECFFPLPPGGSTSIMYDSVPLNWDSLYSFSKNEVLKKVTNNSIGVEDSYYTQYIGDKRGKVEPVRESWNQELEDFKMLVQLCRVKHIRASFVISPLNPFYFRNLPEISPTMDIVKKEISANGFSYLDLLETDTAKYEKAILHDVMHMSDYGWYKVDQYMIRTYHPEQYRVEQFKENKHK